MLRQDEVGPWTLQAPGSGPFDFPCHCEKRSDEAIHLKLQLDCRARLRRTRNDKRVPKAGFGDPALQLNPRLSD